MGLDGELIMARITFKNQSDYFLRLKKLEETFKSDEPLERAVSRGAAPVADAIRKNLEALPTEDFRVLPEGETFKGLPKHQKKDLVDSFGLTPVERDRNGFVNTKAGFDGYGHYKTKIYPQGLPNQLLARAVESGSSVRQKTPFVRPAVNATRKKSIEEMEKSIDEDLKKIF